MNNTGINILVKKKKHLNILLRGEGGGGREGGGSIGANIYTCSIYLQQLNINQIPLFR